MKSLIAYIKATKGELNHVTWPTRQQAILLTVLVIVISIIIAYFIGLFDYVFSWMLERFVL